ncbi:MAG TPA: NAD(P)H-dependent oxidoreductase [Opitutales bacterium]|nr:NAD(P)H-dependent oxidoreductase [Opitutales bacterium]
MKVLIVLAHPDSASFNHAIAQTAADALASNGHEAILHDLYAEGFDPLLKRAELARNPELDESVSRHIADLRDADALIFVHPNWWGMPPAAMVGWIDRVVRQGVAYKFVAGDKGEGVPVGLLKAKKAMVFNTANTLDAREKAVFGDPLESIWKKCVFGLCGISDVTRRTFSVVIVSDLAQRRAWLNEVAGTVSKAFPKA